MKRPNASCPVDETPPSAEVADATATPAPTSTPQPEPSPAAAVLVASPEPPGPQTVIEKFIAGYRWNGGPEAHLDHIVKRVIPCESEGNPFAFNRVGPFHGLMQFLPATWYAVGGGDWHDPWQQGSNTARLLHLADPATQWPVCWFA